MQTVKRYPKKPCFGYIYRCNVWLYNYKFYINLLVLESNIILYIYLVIIYFESSNLCETLELV